MRYFRYQHITVESHYAVTSCNHCYFLRHIFVFSFKTKHLDIFRYKLHSVHPSDLNFTVNISDFKWNSRKKGQKDTEDYLPWLHREPEKPDRHSQWPVT